ncbi:SCO2584 family spore wall biosynthesis protein [Streptomyces sp. S6]
MPEDVGGTPFPDGGQPDDDHDRGVSDEEFASVVFDEAFVKAAEFHEPTAVERLLAAAEARAEAEAESRRTRPRTDRADRYDDGFGPADRRAADDLDDLDDPEVLDARYGAPASYGFYGTYGKQVRWHRPVAWMLAIVMGIGMVALAFTAVYRGSSSGAGSRQAPPASTGADATPPGAAEQLPSAVPVLPRTP